MNTVEMPTQVKQYIDQLSPEADLSEKAQKKQQKTVLIQQLKDLFKELQSLSSSQEITEDEINAEVEAYRAN